MSDLEQAARQALEALIWTTGSTDFGKFGHAHQGALKLLYPAIEALRQALEQKPCDMGQMCLDCQPRGANGECPDQQPKQEPVSHTVVAGALFDFMGWLTTRNERLILSITDDAFPAVEAIKEFAMMRGLSLDDAQVQDWQNITDEQPKQEPVAWMYDWKTEGVIVTDWVTSDKDEAYSPTKGYVNIRPLYTEPPKREWVGLTDKEIERGLKESWVTEQAFESAVWWAEQKLKELNT